MCRRRTRPGHFTIWATLKDEIDRALDIIDIAIGRVELDDARSFSSMNR